MEKTELTKCFLTLCDGSGLVEKECIYGFHFVRCECRKVEEEDECIHGPLCTRRSVGSYHDSNCPLFEDYSSAELTN